MNTYLYKTKGTCAASISISVEDGILRDLQFQGGCSGNTQGVAALAKNRPIDEVISLVKGIRCGFKSTSCPDQLANALELIRSGELDPSRIREVSKL